MSSACLKEKLLAVYALAAIFILFVALPSQAADPKPELVAPPKWAVPVLYDPRAKLSQVDPSLEMRWLLIDRQIDAQSNQTFHHEIRQLLTPTGVNNGSQISIDYDPGYQTLAFHWIKIWRGTNSFNRLDLDKIKITQPGLDAEELLFDSEKTALLLLTDVRPGDIIDCAYTIRDENPVFAGHFADSLEVQSAWPIERMTTRLIWPASRHLYVKNHGTTIKYTALRKGDLIEFAWNVRQVFGWRDERPVPIWYHPHPWVQLSEFQKWSDVNQLCLTLFSNAAPFSAELKQKISEWKRLPGREEQVLTALRFVQEDVRYLGLEGGVSSYCPAAPSAVFERRFGDCKDKTFLFVTILRALGIEAWPTLVNTRLRQTVFDMNPSAIVFDHAITLTIIDGAAYWLDATANYQRGPLLARSWPNYGGGLVIRRGTTALTAISSCPVPPRRTVTQYLDLGRLGQQSSMKVVTISEGADADSVRAYYATTVRDDIERANLNYYARIYPDIVQTSPVVFTDDEQQNRVEVDEFYNIRDIWSHLPDESVVHCQVYPENIGLALSIPLISVRTMPLGLRYPNHQIFHAQIVSPGVLVFQPDEQTVQNPAFYFHRTAVYNSGKVFLDCEYRAESDAVEPDAVPNYIRQLDQASKYLLYTITSN